MNPPSTAEKAITTSVVVQSSRGFTQLTFFSSLITSLMYSLIFFQIFIFLTGQEGFEPPTYGFGVRRSTVRATGLFNLLVNCMFFTAGTEFLQFHPLSFLFILVRMIIPTLALCTSQGNKYTHLYSIISTTVPAPTVRPPSRIANLEFCSSATGVISSISIVTWSPGITISTPGGS